MKSQLKKSGWATSTFWLGIIAIAGQLVAGAINAAASTTLTFTSDGGSAWTDGTANDGEGGSADVPGITYEILNISSTSGANLGAHIEWHSAADLANSQNFSGLTTFTYADGLTAWKGMAIRSTDGQEFQIDQFRWYDWSWTGGTVNVVGYRNGLQVASTTFTANSGDTIVTVNLDSSFDDVDEVRMTYATGGGYPTINNIVVAGAVVPNTAPTITGAPSSVTATEDTASSIDLSSITVGDAEGNNLIVTLAASAGKLTASSSGGVTVGGSGTATLTLSGSIASINTYFDTITNIRYTGATNANGLSAANLAITPNDGNLNGTTANVHININAVNDDPTATGIPASITVLEDTSSDLNLATMTLSDVDSGSGAVTLKLALGSGTMGLANPGPTITATGNGTGTVTLTGTISNLNFYLSIPSNIQYFSLANNNGMGADTLSLTITDNGNTGAGGGGIISLGTVTINITPVNDAPTDITLSKSTLNESAGAGATVGSLTTADVDVGDAHTYSLVAGTGADNNSSFTIVGNLLEVGGTALTAGSYSARIQTDDGHGGTFAKAFTITVADDIAPVITSASTANGVYGSAFNYTITASGGATTFGAAGLPAGLSVSSSSGAITGTPTQTGVFAATITAADAAGNTDTNSLSVTITKGSASLILTGLNQVYDGTGKIVGTTTTPTGLTVDLTYNGSAAAPTNVGSYEVIGTINDANYTGSATNTLVIAKANADVTLTGLNQVYDGNGKSVTVTTAPTGLTVDLTYNGNAAAPTNAGSYEVIGTINDANYTGSATNTLVIAKANADVILSSLNQVYDGNGKSVTVTTTPTGLTVDLTYNGNAAAPTNAGSYEVIGTVNNSNYTASVTNTLEVSKASVTITADDQSRAYGQSNPTLTGTVTGAVSTDNLSATYSTTATQTSPAGQYPIVPTPVDPLNRLSNYQVTTNNGTLTITAATPSIAFSIGSKFVTLGDSPTALDSLVTLSGSGRSSLAGATLTFTSTTNAGSDDLLSVVSVGTGPGEIAVDNQSITYGGVSIATYSGGNTGQVSLTFSFNASATEASVQALLRQLSFSVTANTATNLERAVEVVFNDGQGGISDPAILAIELNHRPVATSDRVVTGTNLPVHISFARMIANDSDEDGDSITVLAVATNSAAGGTAVSDADGVTFTPSVGFSGVDQLSYTVGDGRSGVTTGVVQIYVLADGQLAMQDAPGEPAASNGKAAVGFMGVPGRTYRILASDDFFGWTQVGTVTAPAEGFVLFSDPGSDAHIYRFYRTVFP